MATLPPYNWRVPLMTDRPAGAQQMTDLATDIAATVSIRATASTVRAADSSQVSVTTAVSPGVSLPDAPAGLYLASAVVLFANTDSQYHANYGQFVVNGQTTEAWRWDSADAYRRAWQMVLPFPHAGGSLTVTANIRGNTFVVYAGSRTDVLRVGA